MQIYDEILLRIRNQGYLPGDFLPTETELGKEFGASRPTVAKALNLLGKEKLVRRKAGFGTQVLAPSQSKLLTGLLVPQILETEIFEPICASIANTAGQAGMRVIHPSQLNFAGDLKSVTASLAETFIAEKVKGVFFAPAEHIPDQQAFNLRLIERFSELGIRVVLLDRDIYPWPRQSPCDLVGIDNIEAGYVVASHLIASGCRKLAFVSRPNPAATVQLRRIGCREALVQNGLRARSLLTVDFHKEAPEEAVAELLAEDIDGIICANDATAAPLLRSLLDAGADIPGTHKVCGFDDVKYASLLSVPLTTFQQPCENIGRVAAEVMQYRLKNPDAPFQRITLQGKLIIRGSSRKP
ncbi:GntR family transcriptional regulator [Roseibacillus ishigakijimensis]|uniref:GntR family transcriptional regulator n=1 Tax=Roseibacillus ishigakijimensis TaxID=454146 RepID=A0A934RKQ5_9BACT|nr:GntR family transcriptional regulator [Roseibacillus ishigakijimensis]